MRHYFHVLVGTAALLMGVYLLTQPAFAADPVTAQQSVMQPYVATPDDIARARQLTDEYYSQQPAPHMRVAPQQATPRPSAWPVVKHDNPQSLGGGFVMEFVYPKAGWTCAVVRDEQSQAIVHSDCGPSAPGAAR